MKDEKIKKANIFLLVIIIILIIILIFVIMNKAKDHNFKEEINGKEIEVSFRVGTFKKPDEIEKELKKMINNYKELFSTEKTNKKNNNLYYINNKLELNKALKIDDDLYSLMAYGKDEVYDKSDGKINIAAGYLNKAIKDNDKVSLEATNNNIEAIKLDEKAKTITKTEDILIDFTEIEDGFIIDELTYYLDNLKINNYTLKMGSIIKVGGAPIKDKAHTVDIFKNDSKEKITTLKLNYLACATTDYSNAPVNAKTKEVNNNMSSVTVVALMSSVAEEYANDLYMMKVDQALTYINDIAGVEAIIVDNEGKVHRSNNIKKYE